MLTVRTTTEITTVRGIVPAGQLLTIPRGLLDRLAGRVEVVTTTPQEFRCRACGGTDFRQGPEPAMPRVCTNCQVPEQQHRLGRIQK